jgi:hypothetical protein
VAGCRRRLGIMDEGSNEPDIVKPLEAILGSKPERMVFHLQRHTEASWRLLHRFVERFMIKPTSYPSNRYNPLAAVSHSMPSARRRSWRAPTTSHLFEGHREIGTTHRQLLIPRIERVADAYCGCALPVWEWPAKVPIVRSTRRGW